MVELVLIGNGFDLAHDLKTKYSDFLEGYLRKRYNLYKESGGVTLEDELIIINKLAEPKHYEGLINYDELDFTPKHDFFKEILYNHNGSNWEGIEREYFKYLYKLITTSEKADTNNNVKLLNKCLTNIKKELIEYLRVTAKENGPFKSNDSILDSLDILFAKCKTDISDSSSKGEFGDSKVVLLNFNYTNTANTYYRYFAQKYEIWNNTILINIHGNLDEQKSIIFGYGDESDRRYSELEESGDNDILSNFKSFDYLHSKAYSKLIGLLENQKYNIHIMGHSCGVSDRVLLKELFCTDNCEKIQIYYHKKEDGSNDYKDKTMNISRIFPLDQKAAMRKKIINIKDCKPL